MRCSTFCTADKYDFQQLRKNLETKFPVKSFPNALYVDFHQRSVFIFPYGVFVSWDVSDQEELMFRNLLASFETRPLSKIEQDEFPYQYGDTASIHQDKITLTDESDILEKLSISYALAQSLKLSRFEKKIDDNVQKTKVFPVELATKGKISLSRKEISRIMGHLFMDRSLINLHRDVLEVPRFFWDKPELEPLYLMAAKDQDITSRIDVMNKRLNVLHDLFEMLTNELNHRHSSTLEWIIILLILIEVVVLVWLEVIPKYF